MKKILSLFLLVLFSFSFFSCSKIDILDMSEDEITIRYGKNAKKLTEKPITYLTSGIKTEGFNSARLKIKISYDNEKLKKYNKNLSIEKIPINLYDDFNKLYLHSKLTVQVISLYVLGKNTNKILSTFYLDKNTQAYVLDTTLDLRNIETIDFNVNIPKLNRKLLLKTLLQDDDIAKKYLFSEYAISQILSSEDGEDFDYCKHRKTKSIELYETEFLKIEFSGYLLNIVK